MSKFKFLKNPFVVTASIVIGALIGLKFPTLTTILAPFGDMYLHLLQMVVIPILISSIVASTGQLMLASNSKLIKKILVYFFIAIVFTSAFGVIVGVVGQPGKNLSQESREALGEYVKVTSFSESKALEVEIYADLAEEEVEVNPIIEFITSIIPNNVFDSLSSGSAMEVVFFTILLGISIGILNTKESKDILSLSSSLFFSFQKIMNTTIYFLPFGLMFLVADQVREVGLGLIYPMLKLIVVFYISGLIFLTINILVIKYRSGTSIITTIRAISESMTISFFTRNSFASIPATVMGLEENLRFERSTCNLLVPLGITLGRYGNIFYFAVVSIFVLQLYEVDYSLIDIAIVFLGSILAGTATSGATGFSTLPLISIVLVPLGVPVEVVLLLLYAIDAIVDPLRTLLIVHVNIATTSLIADIYLDSDKRKRNIYKETIV